MKRIFKKFMNEVKPQINNLGELTTAFNHWVQNAENEEKLKRFQFKAHTTKHTISKWVEFENDYYILSI